MAVHQRMLAFTICPKESIASVCPNQVSSAYPSVLLVKFREAKVLNISFQSKVFIK